ncbi:uncharacterized protein LOC143145473 [Ptiloglossa arizonensis]|uniref:uncharacterized protein LOC143145473 n=1 Tax=Ptiloglossa arizonensis TaxID=3350558 RepID=UPI003F9F0AD1
MAPLSITDGAAAATFTARRWHAPADAHYSPSGARYATRKKYHHCSHERGGGAAPLFVTRGLATGRRDYDDGGGRLARTSSAARFMTTDGEHVALVATTAPPHGISSKRGLAVTAGRATEDRGGSCSSRCAAALAASGRPPPVVLTLPPPLPPSPTPFMVLAANRPSVAHTRRVFVLSRPSLFQGPWRRIFKLRRRCDAVAKYSRNTRVPRVEDHRAKETPSSRHGYASSGQLCCQVARIVVSFSKMETKYESVTSLWKLLARVCAIDGMTVGGRFSSGKGPIEDSTDFTDENDDSLGSLLQKNGLTRSTA